MSTESETHDIEAAYDNMAAVLHCDENGWPSFTCSCGFSCSAPVWEDAGAEMDIHLAKAREHA